MKNRNNIILCTLYLFIAMLTFLISKNTAIATTNPFPLVGAIRWDAWFTGGPGATDEIALTPSVWHDRLPFYATISTSTGAVQIRLDNQEDMDIEITAAKNGGLDYWAFDYYGDANPISNALNKYLSSINKNEIKFSLIVLPQAITASDWPTSAVNHMQDTQYVKVLNNRPLVYVFASGSSISKSSIDLLRSVATSTGLENPYVVWMTGNINDGKVNELGLDAVSSYALAPAGPIDTLVPYSNLITANQDFWNKSINNNVKIIPLVSTGWDPRPRYAYPPPWGVGAHTAVAVGSSSEIAYNLQSASNWIHSNPNNAEANAIIMYAWNEFAEGGWLDPLLLTGSERLDAISLVKNGTSIFDSIPPTIDISSPISSTTVSGIVNLSANASDNVGVVGVQFKIDGTNLGSEITNAPYSMNWDTGTVTNGYHIISAVVRDGLLNSVKSQDVIINVNNASYSQPAGSWNLNENIGTTTFDSSINHNNGSLVSGALWEIAKNGSGVRLNGIDGYIGIPDSNTLDGMKAMTLSTWVKLSSLPTQNYVLAGKDSNGSSYRITVGPSGAASFTVATVNNGWYTTGTSINSVGTIKPNVWNHIVGTYDGNFVRIYINGVLDNTSKQKISGNIANSNSQLRFGYKSSSNIDYLSGLVDESSLYSVALSPFEVTDLYNNINLNSDINAPSINITNPSNNTTVSGTTTINVSASDINMSKVEIYIDGLLTSVFTTAPYTTYWDTRSYINNTNHIIKSIAYDKANNISSTTTSVNVSDITLPTVNITNPINGSKVNRGTNVTIQANATDISGINRIDFSINDTILCSDTTSPYSCIWSVPNPRNVTYTIKATAYDSALNSSATTSIVTSK